MDRIQMYQKPTCTTCRQVYKILKNAGIDFDAIDYFVDPLSQATLRSLLKKLRCSPRAILRTNEETYRRLRLSERELSDDGLVELMAKHPELIQRPIVVRGSKAVLARPAERINELL
jgi:arsenate reductase